MSRPDYLQAYDAWISSICQERHTKFPMSLLEKRKMAALFLKKSKRIENDADGVARPNYDDIVSGMSFQQNFESDTRIDDDAESTHSQYNWNWSYDSDDSNPTSYVAPPTPIPQADAVPDPFDDQPDPFDDPVLQDELTLNLNRMAIADQARQAKAVRDRTPHHLRGDSSNSASKVVEHEHRGSPFETPSKEKSGLSVGHGTGTPSSILARARDAINFLREETHQGTPGEMQI